MTGKSICYSAFQKHKVSFAFLRNVISLFLLTLLVNNSCLGKDEPVYDEITLFMSVPGLGSTEIPAIIIDENIYLAVSNVFDFLKIKNTLSPGLDSISGFFITPESPFLIDKNRDLIIFEEKIFYPRSIDLIRTETNLYLRSDFLGTIFGLYCTFNFRSLSVILNTKWELPVIREMRQEAMRNNISQLKGETKADTSISRSYPLFHFGMADWAIVSSQDSHGNDYTRLNLALGGVVLGGETNILLNYNKNYPFIEREQFYLWRFVDNNRPALRQIMAGKIYAQASASIFAPVVGVQFTNTPTTYRRSFGTYVLSDHTEPNWMVELYVNNVLVNYMKADASGFFTFEVPLVYGNSMVKLRYYGPFGEERFTEQNINIPFNFVQLHQFEYTASAGMVEDSVHSKFGRASFNYGLGKRITIGGGIEYLSSVTSGKTMPFLNVSARLASNLLLSSEYIYGVRMKDVISYRLPSNLQFELTYSRYVKGQTAINNNFLEERRAVVSYPFRSKKLSIFSRMTVYQIVLPSSTYTNAETLLSGVLLGVSTNITTYALFRSEAKPYVYSNISATFRLPKKLILTPEVQYEYNQHKFIGVKGELGKFLSSRGYANLFYENNFKVKYQSIGIGFRYDFSFAQLSFFARHGNNTTTLTETARGSLLYNGETKYLGYNSRSSVGRGGLIVVPFLDLNANGKRDKGEPKVYGLKAQLGAGRMKYNKDTTILITELESYISYTLRLNTDAFDNISWQLKNKNVNVAINPNQLRLLEIPVTVSGEVSGMVYMIVDKGRKGLGRIIVSIFDSTGKQVGQTLTESDGFFSYLGLAPGSYTIQIDSTQLDKLHFTTTPASIKFNISNSNDGEVVEEIEFMIRASAEK